MNKTNAVAIAAKFGPKTESWEGEKITLVPKEVDFQGKSTLAIRVKGEAKDIVKDEIAA